VTRRAANLLTILFVTAIFSVSLHGQSPTVLSSTDRRSPISLNGDWHYIVDPYFTGMFNFHHEIKKNGWFLNEHGKVGDTQVIEYDFAKAPTLKVPGDWNTQKDSLFFYEGPLWYQRDFNYIPKPGNRVFLHVGAANYRSWFWVNGLKVCQHEGGFTAFDCEVTTAIHDGPNFVVAAVSNARFVDGVPTLETDWWNYGGLTRDISLVEVPPSFIDEYDLHLDRATRSRIQGWVHVEGAEPGKSVRLSIPELNLNATAVLDEKAQGRFDVPAQNLTLWSPESPKLYKVEMRSGADTLNEEIGFRTIETRGTQILLNGKPIFLQGISIHAEAPYRTGRANTQEDANTLLGWARDLGCNYVRLAHYPHDERMTRTADRLGVLVWSEIPVYWAIQFDNPAVLAKAKQQLTEEIRRDRNKASIIFWSIANETPQSPARTAFLDTLAKTARDLDSSRLITAALLVRSEGRNKIIDDPLGQSLDVIGANEYIGWYEQRPEGADTTNWRIDYQKPLIISEFGGDSPAGLHGSENDRWTEEYQASIYRHQLGMIRRISQLRGLSPWILMDFRSPSRQLPGVQDFFNRKGLISPDGKKKQAFFILQKAYQEWSVGKPE
jgi:beta-glucuronidase